MIRIFREFPGDLAGALPPWPARALGLSGCLPGPASSSSSRRLSASSRAFGRPPGAWGKRGRENGELVPEPRVPAGLDGVGRRASSGLSLPFWSTQLPPFLPPSSLRPRLLSGHRRGFPSHCPQFIASPLPSPSPGLRPGYFLTFYNLL